MISAKVETEGAVQGDDLGAVLPQYELNSFQICNPSRWNDIATEDKKTCTESVM